MSIAQKQESLLAELTVLKNSQDRFAHLIQRGRKSSLPEMLKTESNRVEGCLAKLWFIPEFRDGRCYFQTDSDSAIVKGIAGLLCDLYSGQTPEEILSLDPSFLKKVGIDQHLTQNRRHSLSKIWDKIRTFADQHRAA